MASILPNIYDLTGLEEFATYDSARQFTDDDYARVQALVAQNFGLVVHGSNLMSESHATPPAGPPARRGPMTDLDPSGQVGQKEPDRAERQFLNYAFYKLDPAFRRLPADERESARS